MTWDNTSELENVFTTTITRESLDKLGQGANDEIMGIIGRCLMVNRNVRPFYGGMDEVLSAL